MWYSIGYGQCNNFKYVVHLILYNIVKELYCLITYKLLALTLRLTPLVTVDYIKTLVS